MNTLRCDTRLKTKQVRACSVHIHSLLHSLASPHLSSPHFHSLRPCLLAHSPSFPPSFLTRPSLPRSLPRPSIPSLPLSLSLSLSSAHPSRPPFPSPPPDASTHMLLLARGERVFVRGKCRVFMINLQLAPDWPVRCIFKFILISFEFKTK